MFNSIKVRLISGFGMILLGLLIISSVAIYKITNISEKVEKLYQHPFAVTNATRDLKIGVLQTQISYSGANSASSTSAVINRTEQAMKVLENKFLGDQSLVKSLRLDFEQWKKQAFGLTLVNNPPITFTQLTFRIGKRLDELEQLASTKAYDFNRQMAEEGKQSTGLVVALALMIGLGSLIIIIFLTKGLLPPIYQLTKISQELSQGAGDLTRRLVPFGATELTDLSNNFNLFLKEIQALVVEIKSSTMQACTSAISNAELAGQVGAAVDKQTAAIAETSSLINFMNSSNRQLQQLVVELESATVKSLQKGFL